MEDVTVGRRTISKGKGNRYYINLKNSEENCVGAMHPDLLAEGAGCGVYGFSELRDLSCAVIEFGNNMDSESLERKQYERLKAKFEASNGQ